MISVQHIEESIPGLAGGTVLIIASCSFLLSFFNLQAAALQAGINPWLSWLWPVCIDALLIAGSLMILRSSLRKEPAYVGWSVLLTFTIVSTIFNVLHSPEGLTAQASHAVPPIALCVSIEMLMIIVRNDLNKQGDPVAKTMAKLPLEQSQPVAKMAKEVAKPKSTTITANPLATITTYLATHPAATAGEVAKATGLSRSTARYHMAKMSQLIQEA